MSEAISNISDLLAKTFTISDSIKRQQAEQDLTQLILSQKLSALSLLNISVYGFTPYLRQSASIKLQYLIQDLIKNSLLNPVNKCLLVENIFKIMLLDIDNNIRTLLSLSINLLIINDNSALAVLKLSQLTLENLYGPAGSIFACFQAIKLLFNTKINDFSIKNYFTCLFPYLKDIVNKGCSAIIEAVIGKDNDLIIKIANILCKWGDCFSHIIGYFELVDPKALFVIIRNNEISNIFLCILTIEIVIQDENVVARSLMSIKSAVLKCLNMIVQFLICFKDNIQCQLSCYSEIKNFLYMSLADEPFIVICHDVIGNLTRFLLDLSRNTAIYDIYDEVVKQFIIESLNLCIKCCGEIKISHVFTDVHKKLLSEFIPNALSISKNDINHAENEAEEFVNLSLDLIKTQKSNNIKTKAAKLLKIICQNIEGSLMYILKIIIDNTLDLCLSNIDYTRFMNFTYYEIKAIDNGFLMLCILNNQIIIKKDLIRTLENLLIKHFFILEKKSSGIVQSRLGLVLYCFSEQIFVGHKKWLVKYMWWLIECLSPENKSKVSLIQACETLVLVVQKKVIMLRISDCFEGMMDKIMGFVKFHNSKHFYETVGDILTCYKTIPKTQVLNFLQLMTEKIQFLVTKTQSPKADTTIISKCWDAIKILIKSEQINDNNEYEHILSPLIFLIGQEKLLFEDDIINILIIIMKKHKQVSKIQWDVFNYLPVLQQKQEGSLQNLLKLLLCYIKYGHEYFVKNPHIVFSHSENFDVFKRPNSLVEMGILALFSKKNNEDWEYYNNQGAIFLHLLLVYFPKLIENSLQIILCSVINKYKCSEDDKIVLRNSLLCVVLQALASNFSLTYRILSNKCYCPNLTYIKYIFSEIIKNSSSFKRTYQRKIAVLGVGQIFTQPIFPNELSDLSGQIIEALIQILSSNNPQETTSNILPNKSIIKITNTNNKNPIKHKETYQSASYPYKNKPENNTQTHLQNLNNFDEIKYFSHLLNTLITSNPNFIKSTIISFTENTQNQLINLLQSKIITINNPHETKTIRKILKAKRKNP